MRFVDLLVEASPPRCSLGRRGVVGEPLADATGFVLPFSTWGVVLANTFVAMPFLVITVEGALSSVDRRPEAAAASLGASPLTVFRLGGESSRDLDASSP